jgi:hypothetical protein
MTTTLRALLAAGLVATCFGVAIAKLPAPPPMTDEQKAAAEEKKAKDAAAAKAAAEAQARAEDRVVARYTQEMKAKGVTVKPTPIATVGNAVVSAPAPAAGAAPAKDAAKK